MQQDSLFDTSAFEQAPAGTKAITPEMLGKNKRGSGRRSAVAGDSAKPPSQLDPSPIANNDLPFEENSSCYIDPENYSRVYTELWSCGIRGEILISPTGIILIIHLFRGKPPERIATGHFDIRHAYSLFFFEVNRWTQLCPGKVDQWNVAPRCRNPELGCNFGVSCSLTGEVGTAELGSTNRDDCSLTQKDQPAELGSTDNDNCTLTERERGWLEIKIIKGTRQVYRRWREGGKLKLNG